MTYEGVRRRRSEASRGEGVSSCTLMGDLRGRDLLVLGADGDCS